MQFLPATWKAYGMGGDINDPHDAIFGAANYLKANGGAAGRMDNALFRYNNSNRYVRAVTLYAKQIEADRDRLPRPTTSGRCTTSRRGAISGWKRATAARTATGNVRRKIRPYALPGSGCEPAFFCDGRVSQMNAERAVPERGEVAHSE